MCRGEEGVENDSKHSKSQLKVYGMDELINHECHVYFISTGINSLFYGINTVNSNTHIPWEHKYQLQSMLAHTYCILYVF